MYKTEYCFLGSVGVEPTFKNSHIFVNTFIKILREVSVSSASIMRMVDEVGVEPTLFLMSRIYSPLPSPAGHTHPYWGNRLDLNQ